MSHSLSLTSEVDVRQPMSDIMLRFADSPVHRIGFSITDADIQTLASAYPDRVFRARRKEAAGEFHWLSLILRFGNTLFLQAFGDGREWAEIFAATEDQAVDLHKQISGLLKRERVPEGPFFYMLRFDCSEFLTERVNTLPDDPGDEFLRLCYGDDILPWMVDFSERTTARAGGLTILQGAPGTGKTSLISVMMRRLAESHIFYVLPVAQDSALSSPELVPFWQTQNRRHPDKVKVIVLEDAERLLWARGGDNREAVSSILNVADGLTGRMLRLHIICSVNARMSELDPAILRPGRLTCYRDFRPLGRQAAMRLAESKSLDFRPSGERQEFALAEVLNPGAWTPLAKAKIGFRP
ncbi:AAA family ATPase [Verrucomicrobiota bacterium sgz303538]